jgi:hypothetical protein
MCLCTTVVCKNTADGTPIPAFSITHNTVDPLPLCKGWDSTPFAAPFLTSATAANFVSTVRSSVRGGLQPCRKAQKRILPCAAGPVEQRSGARIVSETETTVLRCSQGLPIPQTSKTEAALRRLPGNAKQSADFAFGEA